MRFTIPLLFLIASCSLFPPKPANEFEQMGEDVLRSKRDEGLEIEIRPIPKEAVQKKTKMVKRHLVSDRPTPPEPDPCPGIEIIKIPF